MIPMIPGFSGIIRHSPTSIAAAADTLETAAKPTTVTGLESCDLVILGIMASQAVKPTEPDAGHSANALLTAIGAVGDTLVSDVRATSTRYETQSVTDAGLAALINSALGEK